MAVVAVEQWLSQMTAAAVGSFLGFTARWFLLEKPQRRKMQRERERRQYRKLDEVKRAVERR